MRRARHRSQTFDKCLPSGEGSPCSRLGWVVSSLEEDKTRERERGKAGGGGEGGSELGLVQVDGPRLEDEAQLVVRSRGAVVFAQLLDADPEGEVVVVESFGDLAALVEDFGQGAVGSGGIEGSGLASARTRDARHETGVGGASGTGRERELTA